MNSNTVYYGQPGRRWRQFTKRSVLVSICGLFVVGVCGWVVFTLANNQGTRETNLDTAIKAADSAFQSGDYEESLSKSEQAISQAKTKEDKIAVYSSLAASAASVGKLADAIDYMQKKHAVAPETADADAYVLGSYYERSGNREEAVRQYKKALAYNKSLSQSAAREEAIMNLEVRIRSLGQ